MSGVPGMGGKVTRVDICGGAEADAKLGLLGCGTVTNKVFNASWTGGERKRIAVVRICRTLTTTCPEKSNMVALKLVTLIMCVSCTQLNSTWTVIL